MQAADLDVIKEIPGYKIIMKAVLKTQIQQLVEQLAETTGEESILLTASVSDGSLSHLGSEFGKVFLHDHDEIKSQFLGFVLKKHHRKKQTEKQFAAGPGRRATATVLPTFYDTEQDQEMEYSETSIHPESESEFLTEPIMPPPSETVVHPVSIMKASSELGPKGAASNVRHEPYPTNRPRGRQGKGGKQTQRSSIDQGHLVKEELDNDSVQSDSKTIKRSTRSASGSITQSVDKDFVSGEQFETEDDEIAGAEGVDTSLIGLSTDTVESNTSMNVAGDSQFGELDENVIIKLEADSDIALVQAGLEPAKSAKPDKDDDPDWVPGTQKKRGSGSRRRSGSRIVTSPRDKSLNQSGEEDELPNQSELVQGHSQYGVTVATTQPAHNSPGKIVETLNTGQSSLAPTLSLRDAEKLAKYSCQICGKFLTCQSALECHMTTHTGIKAFVCDVCGNGFTRKDNLKMHRRMKNH